MLEQTPLAFLLKEADSQKEGIQKLLVGMFAGLIVTALIWALPPTLIFSLIFGAMDSDGPTTLGQFVSSLSVMYVSFFKDIFLVSAAFAVSTAIILCVFLRRFHFYQKEHLYVIAIIEVLLATLVVAEADIRVFFNILIVFTPFAMLGAFTLVHFIWRFAIDKNEWLARR